MACMLSLIMATSQNDPDSKDLIRPDPREGFYGFPNPEVFAGLSNDEMDQFAPDIEI